MVHNAEKHIEEITGIVIPDSKLAKADVLELKDPNFKRGNFCCTILNSKWAA